MTLTLPKREASRSVMGDGNTPKKRRSWWWHPHRPQPRPQPWHRWPQVCPLVLLEEAWEGPHRSLSRPQTGGRRSCSTDAPSVTKNFCSRRICCRTSSVTTRTRGKLASTTAPSAGQATNSIYSFLHLVASLFHTDFSYSTPLLLPWARFFHLPLKPKSKGNKTQSQKQHKGQDTNYYPAWKYLHNLCVASAGNGKFISNP